MLVDAAITTRAGFMASANRILYRTTCHNRWSRYKLGLYKSNEKTNGRHGGEGLHLTHTSRFTAYILILFIVASRFPGQLGGVLPCTAVWTSRGQRYIRSLLPVMAFVFFAHRQGSALPLLADFHRIHHTAMNMQP